MDEEWLSLIRPRHMWRTRRGVKFDAKVVASFTGAYLAGMVKFAGPPTLWIWSPTERR
jgi:hypothetical protein